MKKISLILVLFVLVTTFFSCSDDAENARPKVETGLVTDISSSSADVVGLITDDGGSEITEAGFVYGENTVPTTADSKLSVDEVSGILEGELENLDGETIYYVRAYATNSKGTGYGNAVQFTTSTIPGPTNGLISYYSFDGDSEDDFGANDGVDTSVSYVTTGDESGDKAVQFSGTNSFITLPANFELVKRTISFNFSATTVPAETSVIYTSDNMNTQFGFTALSVSEFEGVKKLNLNVSNALIRVTITENTWYNVIVIVQGLSYKYYVNGTLISSGTIDEYAHSSNGVLTAVLGSIRTTASNFFTGKLDDLRIYNRAVTTEEVAVLAGL